MKRKVDLGEILNKKVVADEILPSIYSGMVAILPAYGFKGELSNSLYFH